MGNYENIRLDKGMYHRGEGLTALLEGMDPTSAYQGTPLAGLDAYQRQLKRFGIKVSGKNSDAIEKFFSTADSAALFPEYVARAVRQGVKEANQLEQIVATVTKINALDYRTITTEEGEHHAPMTVAEGGFIPETRVKLKEQLVHLTKRGRMLCASYEAIKFQRLDLFTVALRQIGAAIAKAQLQDAIDTLLHGDGDEQAPALETSQSGSLSYSDLVALWNRFEDFEMNTLLAAPDMAQQMLLLSEMQAPAAGLDFQGSGRLITPLGASLLRSSLVPAGTVIALDRRCALEMVQAGDIQVDYDRLIDCQLERAAITATTGFSRIFPDAVQVLTLKA